MIRILLIVALAFAATKNYRDGFEDTKVASVSADIISESRAIQLFDQFVQDKSISFSYPIDGCYARAMAMARIADAENISMAKIYVDGALHVKNAKPNYPDLWWGYHVAPVLPVKQKDGKIVDMVFDPAVLDRPVPVDEWLEKLQAPSEPGYPEPSINEVYYGSKYQFGPRDVEMSKRNWQTRDLENTKKIMSYHLSLTNMTAKKETTAPAKQVEGVR